MPEPSEQPLAESLPDLDPMADAVVVPETPPRTGRKTQYHNEPEVEGALRQANLERVRGNRAAAEKTLREVLLKYPAAGALHEAVGDLSAERGDPKAALASYRRAESCGVGSGIDAKIARIALKQDRAMSSLTDNIVERGMGPIPLVASVLVPGLGLALVGELRSAAITFVGAMIPFVLTLAIPGIRDVFVSLDHHQEVGKGWTFLFIVLSLISSAFWIYSIILTNQVSKPADKDGSFD
jgi:hypothetical protein